MMLEGTKMQGPGAWMDIAKDHVRASRTRKAKRAKMKGEDKEKCDID
jgi:hypothetical protein